MKQRIGWKKLDAIDCEHNFQHFSNRLNKAVLRNSFTRYGNRIRMIPVLERSHSQRYHYHTVLDRLGHVTRPDFKDIVGECWNQTLWGYREIDFQYDISSGWINAPVVWCAVVGVEFALEDYSVTLKVQESIFKSTFVNRLPFPSGYPVEMKKSVSI
jgi:hypothetical protein